MLRIVRNAALLAALVTVAVAVWRDYGALITLKRAAMAYLATFFVTGGLVFLAHIALSAHQPPPPEPEPRPKRRKKRRPRRVPDDGPEASEQPDEAAEAETPAPAPEPEPTTTS